jgi:hypothetical protein
MIFDMAITVKLHVRIPCHFENVILDIGEVEEQPPEWWCRWRQEHSRDTDEDLATALEERGVPGVARIIRNWENDMIR